MDIDDILDDKSPNGENLILNGIIRDYLSESARWGKFLSIVGFVGLGLVVLMLLSFGSTFLSMVGVAGLGGVGILAIIFYLAMLALALVPLYYLYQFSTKMQTALRNDDQNYLVESFQNHKSLFKFYGIIVLIGLGINVLSILLGLLGLAFG